MNRTSAGSRRDALARLTGDELDLLVIGGGIVGAGVARDAAMRGLRTGLVEQHDFAFGTSSRSSRLLHGGMRYLAQGRLGLVRQASVEKRVIHAIAPHLAEPLAFVFPSYEDERDWVLWQLKIGVKIYDLLCGGRNFGKSTWLSADEALKRVPALRSQQLKGAVRYYDGFTNDSRLVLDTLRSAARAGATVVNFCRFKNATGGGPWQCELEDSEEGERLVARAHMVVNATGPWGDRLPHSQIKLRVTKGVHLVVDRARLPVSETVVMTEGKRILFAIPWGERTLLGTTDTDYSGSLEDVRVNAEDRAYLLGIAGKFFPGINLRAEEVITGWAGLRPLIADAHGKPSDISRSHLIRSPEPGWWDIAGGKLTTYRLMAEEAVDQMVVYLQRGALAERRLGPCRTAEEPLLPAAETEGVSGIVPPECTRDLVEHYCAREWALHLDDVMLRRTGWQYYQRDARQVAERVCRWMAEWFKWPENRQAEELRRCARATEIDSQREPNLERRTAVAGR